MAHTFLWNHVKNVANLPSHLFNRATMFEHSDYHSGPPLTEAEIASFETDHAIRFPAALRTALLKSNGGHFTNNRFKCGGELLECPGFRPLMKPEAEIGETVESVQAIVDRSGEYGQLTKLLGNLAKVFIFGEHDGYFNFALNFNDQPASIWYIFLDTDGTGEARKIAPSWEVFLTLQYAGEEKPSVDIGRGWSGYKILYKGQQRGEDGGAHRSILGLKGSTLRCQAETKSDDAWELVEVEWDGTASTASLRFERNQFAVSVSGDGVSLGKSCTRENGRWTNVEGQQSASGTAYFDNLEDALNLFREIDRLSTRYGLSARRPK
jgi:hypothetical protein